MFKVVEIIRLYQVWDNYAFDDQFVFVIFKQSNYWELYSGQIGFKS